MYVGRRYKLERVRGVRTELGGGGHAVRTVRVWKPSNNARPKTVAYGPPISLTRYGLVVRDKGINITNTPRNLLAVFRFCSIVRTERANNVERPWRRKVPDIGGRCFSDSYARKIQCAPPGVVSTIELFIFLNIREIIITDKKNRWKVPTKERNIIFGGYILYIYRYAIKTFSINFGANDVGKLRFLQWTRQTQRTVGNCRGTK